MGKPNIIVIVADQLNNRHLGFSGHKPVKTPCIDRLAASGVSFKNAFCQAPLCMPSRASFNTGLYPHVCRVRYNNNVLHSEFATLADILKNNGYNTAGFGHIGGDGLEQSLDIKCDLYENPLRGAWMKEQDHVLDGVGKPAYFCGALPYGEEETLDCISTLKAIDYIKKQSGGKTPFYLQLNFYKPHIPHIIAREYAGLYNEEDVILPESCDSDLKDKPPGVVATKYATGMGEATTNQVKKALAHYYGAISYIDAQVEKVTDALNETGLINNSIILFFSDHGDYAGEFGMIGKSGNFYDTLINVPLIFSGPSFGIRVNEMRNGLVELTDIVPTICDLLGINCENPVNGVSRKNMLISEEDTGSDYVFCETSGGRNIRPPDRIFKEKAFTPVPSDPYSSGPYAYMASGMMVRDRDYKLAYYQDGSIEFYDLKKDPGEIFNLASNPQYSGLICKYMAVLLSWQMKTWSECTAQDHLPYHYRAINIKGIPAGWRKARIEWDAGNHA